MDTVRAAMERVELMIMHIVQNQQGKPQTQSVQHQQRNQQGGIQQRKEQSP